MLTWSSTFGSWLLPYPARPAWWPRLSRHDGHELNRRHNAHARRRRRNRAAAQSRKRNRS